MGSDLVAVSLAKPIRDATYQIALHLVDFSQGSTTVSLNYDLGFNAPFDESSGFGTGLFDEDYQVLHKILATDKGVLYYQTTVTPNPIQVLCAETLENEDFISSVVDLFITIDFRLYMVVRYGSRLIIRVYSFTDDGIETSFYTDIEMFSSLTIKGDYIFVNTRSTFQR